MCNKNAAISIIKFEMWWKNRQQNGLQFHIREVWHRYYQNPEGNIVSAMLDMD